MARRQFQRDNTVKLRSSNGDIEQGAGSLLTGAFRYPNCRISALAISGDCSCYNRATVSLISALALYRGEIENSGLVKSLSYFLNHRNERRVVTLKAILHRLLTQEEYRFNWYLDPKSSKASLFYIEHQKGNCLSSFFFVILEFNLQADFKKINYLIAGHR